MSLSIIKQISNRRLGGFSLHEKAGPDTVAEIEKGNKTMYLNKSIDGQYESVMNENNHYNIGPFINLGLERQCILINGPSRMGKSCFAFYMLEQIITYTSSKTIYFFSAKRYENDRNLKSLDIEQIDEDGAHEMFDVLKRNELRDVVLYFDDIDTMKSKIFSELCNLAVEIGGEFNVSVLFVSHNKTDLGRYKIYNDFDLYTTFYDFFNDTNTILTKRLSIDPTLIKQLKEYNCQMYSINKLKKCIICDKVVINY